ncbi:MAG: magnesium/cobalt transporter CorA [Gammaproteobacteria bacterium]|nr:magnesium/cobalt transporter CorA [Gammaproteobacteria bacterium]
MFTKNNPDVGARPGTLAIPENSPEPRIRVTQYSADDVEVFDIEDVSTLPTLVKSNYVTWVDIQGFGNEAKLRGVAEAFGLHPIALENAVNVPQRAKAESYAHSNLIIARSPVMADDGAISVPQVCFIVGDGFLITFQERYLGFFDAVRERIQVGGGPMRTHGPDYLAYALIDAMVDRYYPIAQQLSDAIEDLEDWVVENPHPEVLTRIHMIRRQLVVLRRVGHPQREAINMMLRPQSPFFTEPVQVFVRDTRDHIAQIVELIDSSREMASDLADAYLSNVSHRSNEIMKVLTLMASIFIPLTFIAGVYGMNFEYIPELTSRIGYFVVWGIMISITVFMVFFFRRRGWIGTEKPPPTDS